jgi:sigma-B regulation protein RsbU (phosphoserine phosphatase)
MKKLTLQHAVLALLLFWALVAESAFSIQFLYHFALAGRSTPLPFQLHSYTNRIESLLPEYEGSPLRRGDEVLQINGRDLTGREDLDRLRNQLHAGQTLPVTVRRTVSGTLVDRKLNVPLQRISYPTLGWVVVLALLLLPFSCLLIGFFIAFVRPYDGLAWITMAMIASFGQITGSTSTWTMWEPWRALYLTYHSLLSNLWPLWLLLFAVYFPVPFRFVRRWMVWLIAVPYVAIAAVALCADLAEGNHVRELARFSGLIDAFDNFGLVVFGVSCAAFVGMLIIKRRMLAEPDARRRLVVLIAGCSIAVLPIAVYVLVDLGILKALPPWLNIVFLIMLLFFPATMAYVIVVQRAMDIRIIVRTGVRYALASTGLRTLQVLLFLVVILFTLRFALDAEHHWQTLLTGMIGALILFGLQAIGNRVALWTDRRFFREAYNAEVILTELANSVATFRDTKALMDTISHRIRDSLHSEPVVFLLERNAVYKTEYALGAGFENPHVEFSRHSGLARFLTSANAPGRVYFDDPQSWVHGLNEAEGESLRRMRTQILVPVTHKSRMLGILSLGPKKSEAPYSRRDLQLLGGVASQAALALENVRLAEDMRQEVAQRERLNRELEIARDVQQRLFPQQLPDVKGLDFAGYCRPASGVGGDYYDFIRLDDGCLGIAIGDVSGKGIAAALMMASLQASLRGQTIKPCSTLSEMIAHINRLVFDASASNRYATFFYAQYDPMTRLLRYCNAGHNPPMLCRRTNDCDSFYSLDEGGTVIGLFPDISFDEAKVQLQPGDILIGYTDGISEAMNLAEEEFGEERLREIARRCESRSASDMISCMLARVDAFTAGAPQHDDMTLIVVRAQ